MKNILLAAAVFFPASAAGEAPSKAEAPVPWHLVFPALHHVSHRPGALETIADVERFIREKSVRSVDEFLKELNAADPEMFERSILVFWTKAMQEASYRHPRVLLRSRESKLVLAFNGDPRQLGYDELEMMEYDEDRGRFLFAAKSFSPGKAPVSKTDCAACHAYPYGDPLMNRPLIDPYPNWPRWYGGTVASPKAEYEAKEYEAFRASAAGHPRYKYLKLEELSFSCDPNDSPDGKKPRVERKGSGPVKPIIGLHTALSMWNIDRVIRLLSAHPKYEEVRPRMIELLRREIAARFENGDPEAKYSFTPVFNKGPFYDAQDAAHDAKDPEPGYEYAGDGYDSQRCSVFENFEAPRPSTHSVLLTKLLKEELDFDLDFQGMSLSRWDRAYRAGVRFLPDVFLKAVENTPGQSGKAAWPGVPEPDARLVLKAACSSCHREGNSLSAREIPFADPAALDSVLDGKLIGRIRERVRTDDPYKRMPKHLPPLSQEERDALFSFLDERSPYKTPEDILARYGDAIRGLASTESVRQALVEYSACRAYRDGSGARCGEVDRILGGRLQLENCRPLYLVGAAYKDLIGGSGRIENCKEEVLFWQELELRRTGEEPHDPPELAEEFCRKSVPFWKNGDVEGFCRLEAAIFPDEELTPEASYRICMDSFPHFKGNEEDCRGASGVEGVGSACVRHARLVKALREGRPGLVAGTYHAPLLDPKANCQAPANKVMMEYRKAGGTHE